VSVSPGTAALVPQQSVALAAIARDAGANPLSGRTIVWSSLSPNLAAVDGNGTVMALAVGSAVITATSEGKTGSATVTVSDGGFISPGGGTVTAAAGNAIVQVPAGALASATAITVTPVTNPFPDPRLIPGTAYEFGPNGTAFAQPVTVRIKYSDASLPGGAVPGQFRLHRLVGTTWTLVTGSSVDVASRTVTGQTSGFSTYAILELPVPVATVAVTPGSFTLAPGQTATLSATLRDASNNILTGRVVTWSTGNSGVATVSQAGVVTAVAPGTVAISATSEGQVGTAFITVQAPVASVVLTGSLRTKVGDSYTYTATARLSDNTIVVRPLIWGILEASKGSITPGGVLTPLQTGVITIMVTIDGIVWTGTTTGYDWVDASSGGSLRVALESDGTITNKWGASEYPQLVLSCTASGYFFLWVSTSNFVTHNGLVTYTFDSGPFFSPLWDELAPSYSSLWHPGPSGSTKLFAQTMAAARIFGFAFTEFNASAKAMLFRVTGLGSRLAPLLAACPSNFPGPLQSLALTESGLLVDRLGGGTPATSVLTVEQQGRQAQGPGAGPPPTLGAEFRAPDTQVAVRRR